MQIKKDISETSSLFAEKLRYEKSFDIVRRDIRICGKCAFMLFIDGFMKDEISERLMEFFFKINDISLLADAETFAANCVPYVEVTTESEIEKAAEQILSGALILCIDGFEKCISIDLRTYPQRETTEPERDKVFRGSHDGFVEILIFNTALLRRRIRDADFIVSYHQVGSRSKTDIALCYIKDKVDKKLLDKITKKLESATVESLTMNQESLSEVLAPRKWYNPFPKFKYSERPDTAAAQIMEGDIIILVDNAPSAMILPATIFDIMEEANDYYLPPITGTYLRLTRFLVTLLTTFLTPTWILLLKYPDILPESLKFILINEAVNIPVFLQLLILEIAIDGLKLASLNTPGFLSTPLSVVSAIIVGDFAVDSGWFSAQSLLYMAIVATANYTQPGFELGYALKFMRMALLLAVGLFSFTGYIIGIIVIFIILLCNKTISGYCYLYPLIPFNLKDFKAKVLRMRINS